MQLNIPLRSQTKDSFDCGIVCLQMILEYYGQKKSLNQLKAELKADKIGSYAPQLGTYLLKNGFATEIVTQHPGLFTLTDQGVSQTVITQRINHLLQESTSDQDKKVLNYFLEYLEYGGIINVKIPDLSDVSEGIKNNQPLIALLTSSFLTASQPNFNLHFNVITGFDKAQLYLNDPLPDQRGGKKKYFINDFFYGLYASSYADLDNGCLLKIKKL